MKLRHAKRRGWSVFEVSWGMTFCSSKNRRPHSRDEALTSLSIHTYHEDRFQIYYSVCYEIGLVNFCGNTSWSFSSKSLFEDTDFYCVRIRTGTCVTAVVGRKSYKTTINMSHMPRTELFMKQFRKPRHDTLK